MKQNVAVRSDLDDELRMLKDWQHPLVFVCRCIISIPANSHDGLLVGPSLIQDYKELSRTSNSPHTSCVYARGNHLCVLDRDIA